MFLLAHPRWGGFAKATKGKEKWLFSKAILRTVEGIWFKIKAISL